MSEDYPGQKFFHEHNPNIKATERRAGHSALRLNKETGNLDKFDPNALLDVTVLGEPISKTRPRFVSKNYEMGEPVQVYSDQAGKQKQFAWYIRCLAPKFKMQPKSVILAIELVFNATSKSVDIDNLVKFVLDAGNGFLWEDDRQIEKLMARLNRVERDPSVEIVLYRSE